MLNWRIKLKNWSNLFKKRDEPFRPVRADMRGSYVHKEKPNSKRWKNELDRCYMPYTSECYDWDYLVTIFMNEYRMSKYDAVDLVATIRQEVYG